MESYQDPLVENEDFSIIFRDEYQGHNHYVSNDLTHKRNYQNTSFKMGGPPTENVSWWDNFLGLNWPLPYRSTFVWPIQQKESPEINLDEIGCIGFLSVDSSSKHVFQKEWDFDVGAIVADALFSAIYNYQNKEGE